MRSPASEQKERERESGEEGEGEPERLANTESAD